MFGIICAIQNPFCQIMKHYQSINANKSRILCKYLHKRMKKIKNSNFRLKPFCFELEKRKNVLRQLDGNDISKAKRRAKSSY